MVETKKTVKIHDKNLEKHIEKHMSGCMSGFFNIFYRSNRLYPKRLPSPPVCDSASEAVSSTGSPALSREFEKPKPLEVKSPAPEKNLTPVALSPALKNSSPTSPWKFAREAPRLSLDSRAITDAKGGLRPREIRTNNTASNSRNAAGDEENQRRSPSVIARLMGLEPLSSSAGSEPEKKSELRRSASESRSRESYRFVDTPSFLCPARDSAGERKLDHSVVNRRNKIGVRSVNQINSNTSKMSVNQRRLMLEKKSYYDTADFFPVEIPVKQQHQAVSIYGEIERRLRTRGLEEPSKDLETLKHILEALQLKGLLHSSTSTTTSKPVHDRRFFLQEEESPIVLMKPANRRRNNNCSSGEPALSPRRERLARSVARSPGRGDNNRSSSPTLRRKNTPVVNSHSPVQSPRLTRRSEQTVSRSPRNRRPTNTNTTEDELSTSSLSTSSFTDNERWRIEEYKEGRNILERCDKLLHNIAEITANSSSNSNSAELQQPSPVSVLDSSFYKEDELSPSPVKKRSLDFKDQGVIELEDGPWSPSSSTQLLKLDNNDIDSSDDPEFSYVAEVIRAYIYCPDDKNLFFLLQNQTSIKSSSLERKLLFDTTIEILDRNRQLPPWKAISNPDKRPILDQIWSEFQSIREKSPSEDLLEVICGVLKKDLSRDSVTGWTDSPTEMSEAILDIERLIFKDLINESIQDLVKGVPTICRKLVF